MSRKEQEKVVRSVKRTCRGPLPQEARDRIAALFNEGSAESREAAALINRNARQGCGQDINDVICSNPFDGEEHAYECPKCGNAGTYRAPKF